MPMPLSEALHGLPAPRIAPPSINLSGCIVGERKNLVRRQEDPCRRQKTDRRDTSARMTGWRSVPLGSTGGRGIGAPPPQMRLPFQIDQLLQNFVGGRNDP